MRCLLKTTVACWNGSGDAEQIAAERKQIRGRPCGINFAGKKASQPNSAEPSRNRNSCYAGAGFAENGIQYFIVIWDAMETATTFLMRCPARCGMHSRLLCLKHNGPKDLEQHVLHRCVDKCCYIYLLRCATSPTHSLHGQFTLHCIACILQIPNCWQCIEMINLHLITCFQFRLLIVRVPSGVSMYLWA